MNGRRMESPTTPLPLTLTSRFAICAEATELLGDTSVGPDASAHQYDLLFTVHRDGLSALDDQITVRRYPADLGAQGGAQRVLAAGCTGALQLLLLLTFARLAHGPVARVTPASAVMELAALDFLRCW